MSNTSTSIDLTFKNFDFKLDIMRFIEKQLTSARNANVSKLADTMRWWGSSCSANPNVDVTYQLRVEKTDEKIIGGSEFVNIGTPDVEDAFVSGILTTIGKDDYGDLTTRDNRVSPKDALTIYDTRLAAVKDSLKDSPFLNAYVALRDQIAMAAGMAQSADLKEQSIAFEIEDGDVRHGFKIVVGHFQFLDSAVVSDAATV